MAHVNETLTVWSVLRDALMPEVDRLVVVLAPTATSIFERTLAVDEMRSRVSVAVQERPTGMGDAVFTARSFWGDFESIAVVWGDQVNLSKKTLRRTIEAHLKAEDGVTIPLIPVADPYVQYDFDDVGHLYRIRQRREHDKMDPEGNSDVGVFALYTRGLNELWQEYRASCTKGSVTEEINFLPFLVFLAGKGWPTRIVAAECADEVRGINTPADLAFARQRFVRTKHAAAGG
jgi:bifunctional UDP-N-acetylglucosamine pyrophosphorylase/glucosamine-1-phosphate N-acetyltransferase